MPATILEIELAINDIDDAHARFLATFHRDREAGPALHAASQADRRRFVRALRGEATNECESGISVCRAMTESRNAASAFEEARAAYGAAIRRHLDLVGRLP